MWVRTSSKIIQKQNWIRSSLKRVTEYNNPAQHFETGNGNDNIIRHVRNLQTSFPAMVCLGVLSSSLTTCSDSNVMKQNPFLWFFVLSKGISTSMIWKNKMRVIIPVNCNLRSRFEVKLSGPDSSSVNSQELLSHQNRFCHHNVKSWRKFTCFTFIKLTLPKFSKKFLISSSEISLLRPPTKILPCLALAFLGSTFLLLMVCSPAAITLSMESGALKTMNAKPRDRPVLGSVFTLMLSISPYAPKWSRNSSVK